MSIRVQSLSMAKSPRQEADSSTSSDNKDVAECPTCGKVCKSKKGMRQHHKRSHGESIAKTEIECARCGDMHKRWKSQLREGPNYCSQDCRLNALHENYDPETNRKEVECDNCGMLVERRVSRVERAESLYCSRQCANEGHSDRVSGDGNPRWVGGYEKYYGESWPEQRNKARKRDGFTCQRCGLPENKHNGELSVHHKIPFRKFESAEKANQLENLLTLCVSCHGKVEAWPVQPL